DGGDEPAYRDRGIRCQLTWKASACLPSPALWRSTGQLVWPRILGRDRIGRSCSAHSHQLVGVSPVLRRTRELSRPHGTVAATQLLRNDLVETRPRQCTEQSKATCGNSSVTLRLTSTW